MPRTSLSAGPPLAALAAFSVTLFALRLYAAFHVGFGDSEALYACYALFPQSAYLDHPRLIGLIARAIGGGVAPLPLGAHLFTSAFATLAPWLVVLVARGLRCTARASALAGLVTAVAPEVAVGLFGLTPDLPLFFTWLTVIGLFGRALLSLPGSTTAAALFVASGVVLGASCSAKLTGLTLGLALTTTLLTKPAREHARTPWPWVALALAAIIFAPLVAFEAHAGWPMLRHRLIDTQREAGLSLRNASLLVLGQAGYLSPVLLVAALIAARDLVRRRDGDVIVALLRSATVVPLVVLGGLCIWSRVAEPHWLAPAWLPLPLYVAYTAHSLVKPKLGLAAIVTAGVTSLAVYAWVLIPGMTALIPASSYNPRLDIANELFGWPEVAAEVEKTALSESTPLDAPGEIVVVGAVWTVCAQLRAALPVGLPVGCVGPNTADFATWGGPSTWAHATTVVLVSDNRAPADASKLFPDRTVTRSQTVTIRRGARVGRVFTVEVLSKAGVGELVPGARPPTPRG